MHNNLYHIVSGTSEDRFDSTGTLEEAVLLARSVVAREGKVDEPVLIEYCGFVIRELVLLPDGSVMEEKIPAPM